MPTHLKLVFSEKSSIKLNLHLVLLVIFLLAITILVSSDPANVTENSGIWNIEAAKNEWYIKNGTITGWCPLNNCDSLNNTWFSGTSELFFRIQQNKTFVGENETWNCSYYEIPDGLPCCGNATTDGIPHNDSNGNISKINCTTIINALDNEVRLIKNYLFDEYSIMSDENIEIINIGDKNYTLIQLIWKNKNHFLNNTLEDDILIANDTIYNLENAGEGEFEGELSEEGDFFELLFSQRNETNENKIGSQLFGREYSKNGMNFTFPHVELKIKTYDAGMTNITVKASFGKLDSGKTLIYKYFGGGDAITGTTLMLDGSAKPPGNSTEVSLDIIVKNSTGFYLLNLDGTTCVNRTDVNPVTLNCSANSGYFIETQIRIPSLAINSKGRIVMMYKNISDPFTPDGCCTYTIYSDDMGGTWSAPFNLSSVLPAITPDVGIFIDYNVNIVVDKNDQFIACAVPTGTATPSSGPLIVLNSTNGVDWNWSNVSTTYVNNLCDIEVGSDNTIHVIHFNFSVGTTNMVHSSFGMSFDPNATDTNIVQITIPNNPSISTAIDRNNNIFVCAEDIIANPSFYNSSDNGSTWTSQTLPFAAGSGESDFCDVVTDNPNSVRVIFQSDNNTDDDRIIGSNSSNGGGNWSEATWLQFTGTPTDDIGYAHLLGSSYPVFNRPNINRTGGMLVYFHWADTGTNTWRFKKDLYNWIDTGRPDDRFYNTNATNGTTDTGDTINFSIECFDESNISNIILSLDDGTGSYSNVSQRNYTSHQFYQQGNFNYTLTASCEEKVRWQFYCNDTAGNIHQTSNYSVDMLGCPEVISEVISMTKGMEVYLDSDRLTLYYSLINLSGIQANGTAHPSTGTQINFIDLEQNYKRNEQGLYIQENLFSTGDIYVRFGNGTNFSNSHKIISDGSYDYWQLGDCDYRQDGDYV